MLVPPTPPPITTACASSLTGREPRTTGIDQSTSKRLDPARVARVGGPLAEPREEPVGVGDVVGVGGAQPLLDDAPHRLAEVRHDPHEPDPGEVALAHAAEIRAQERAVVVLGQVV